ncbi:Glycerophosphoryl diester phosphodiesterase [Butyrivibrio sp. Su6]|uniref:glycerophosphodiester phosphodiesterase family protein n=1 Tax=Butyrivibrio sp. Su6 TaxID=1520810 RepID=UPI00089F0C3D|nr:glycerophosphodiester phosphodiesterase family protein [Butyrivibrio sp. Su6]SEG23789.1 Glycerophosphoryl diester phosphodiesterase [Butyrivibrio sp. Su6]
MVFLKVIGLVLLILLALYLLMIMPRIINKPSREPFTGVLYAHRGLFDNESDAPENSMAAFKKAVDGGYGIECDVQLSKDGVPVIFHDFTLERVTGQKGKVIDYTYDELLNFNLMNSQEKIPRFEDFLKMVDGKVPLIVELKIERFDVSVCSKADELLSKYKGVYCIESFNPFGVHWYKKNRPEIMRGQLSDDFHKDKPEEFSGLIYFLLTYLFFNFLTRPDFIAFNHKYADNISRRLCRYLYGTVAAAWTIKSEQQLENAKKGFDIFIFDSFVPKSGAKL